MRNARLTRILMAALAFYCGGALAALPAPTPEQQKAAAVKKEQAAAQAAKEKEELAASMDKVAARWRSRAAANGWETHPPTPIAAAPATAAAAPVRSEKSGTAPPSEDVKDPAKKGK